LPGCRCRTTLWQGAGDWGAYKVRSELAALPLEGGDGQLKSISKVSLIISWSGATGPDSTGRRGILSIKALDMERGSRIGVSGAKEFSGVGATGG